MKWTAILIAAAVYCSAPLLLLAGDETGELKPTLLSSVPTKWRQFEALSKRLQGQVSGHEIKMAFGKKTGEKKWKRVVKQSPASALMAENLLWNERGKTRVHDEVLCYNSKYAFKLTRKDETQDWRLAAFEMNPHKKLTQTGIPLADEILVVTGAHFRFTTQWSDILLADAIQKPGFVTKVREVQRNGRKLVRVDCNHSEKLGAKHYTVPGFLLLDPQLGWCLLEYQLDYPEYEEGAFEVLRVVNELTTGTDGLPILKKLSFRHSYTKPRGTEVAYREVIYDYDLHEQAAVPEDAFRLSAYGLPEPAGVAWEEPPRWYLWFLGIGLLAVLGSGYWFLRLRRHRTKVMHMQKAVDHGTTP